MQNKDAYTLYDIIRQWLDDNNYQYDFEDYADFVLLYASIPNGSRKSGGRLSIGRGSWSINLLDNGGEKRGIMILKDRIQIGNGHITTRYNPKGEPSIEHSADVIEIQAWDPTLFDKLKAYLS